MKWQWRTLTGIVLVALASGLAWTGYRYLQLTTPVQSKPPSVLSSATEVFFRVDSPSGRTDMTGETAKAMGFSGRPIRDLTAAFPGWKPMEVTEKEVVLIPRKGASPIYVGLKGGFVTIFFGLPAKGLVTEVTGIPASSLMTQDRTRLTKGIGVSSLEEAWRLLEGLAG